MHNHLNLNLSTVAPSNIKTVTQGYDLNDKQNGIVSIINSFINIEKINLDYNGISDEKFDKDLEFIFDALRHLESLKKLSLSHLTRSPWRTSHSNDSLPNNIAKLQSLEELDLSYNWIQKVPLEITELTNLKKLNMGGNYLLQDFLDIFKQLDNLVELNLTPFFSSDHWNDTKQKELKN